MSSFWRTAYRVQYRILAVLDPLIRAVWQRTGIGITVELRVQRRAGGVIRSRLVGLLRTGDGQYIGHPNGEVGWTRDLEAAGGGVIVWPNGTDWEFNSVRLEPGPERERAIRATDQQPFPGNLTYRLGRRHILREGVYFRLEAVA